MQAPSAVPAAITAPEGCSIAVAAVSDSSRSSLLDYRRVYYREDRETPSIGDVFVCPKEGVDERE